MWKSVLKSWSSAEKYGFIIRWVKYLFYWNTSLTSCSVFWDLTLHASCMWHKPHTTLYSFIYLYSFFVWLKWKLFQISLIFLLLMKCMYTVNMEVIAFIDTCNYFGITLWFEKWFQYDMRPWPYIYLGVRERKSYCFQWFKHKITE